MEIFLIIFLPIIAMCAVIGTITLVAIANEQHKILTMLQEQSQKDNK